MADFRASSSGTSGSAQRFATGELIVPRGTAAALTVVADEMNLVPIDVVAGTADRIGVRITVVGAANSVVRLGVYEPQADGRPKTLLLDAGTVLGTGTGDILATISQVFGSGLYWLAAVGQGAPATQPTITCLNAAGFGSPMTVANLSSTLLPGYTYPGVSGALPSSLTISSLVRNNAVRVGLRGA